jgi:hypothetical protein
MLKQGALGLPRILPHRCASQHSDERLCDGRRLRPPTLPRWPPKVLAGTLTVNGVIHRLSTIGDSSVLFVTTRGGGKRRSADLPSTRFVRDTVLAAVDWPCEETSHAKPGFGVVRLTTRKLSTIPAPGAGQHRPWCSSAPRGAIPRKRARAAGVHDCWPVESTERGEPRGRWRHGRGLLVASATSLGGRTHHY